MSGLPVPRLPAGSVLVSPLRDPPSPPIRPHVTLVTVCMTDDIIDHHNPQNLRILPFSSPQVIPDTLEPYSVQVLVGQKVQANAMLLTE